MEVAVVNFGGGSAGVMQVADSFVARKYNSALVHQVVCANMSNKREGNRAQKTRAEVSHTTRKLFRQKGSGRARGGMSSSPIRRGGGRAFPSRVDENFTHKVPRRMFRAAMAVMLSQLLREQRLIVVKSLTMESPKTAKLISHIRDMKINNTPVLLIDTEEDMNVALSVRNVPHVHYNLWRNLMPADLAAAQVLVLTERALQAGVTASESNTSSVKKADAPKTNTEQLS